MQWPDLISQLTSYLMHPPSADFTTAIQRMVGNAELRILRDLDPLATRHQNTTLSLTAGVNALNLAGLTGTTVGGFPVAYEWPVHVERLSAKVVGNAYTEFLPVSLDVLDYFWPDATLLGAPGQAPTAFAYYAMVSDTVLKLAPTPAGNYPTRVTGKWRPKPMGPDNRETYLGDVYDDLFFAAVMVEAVGWQRDFGQQADDPKIAQSWEAQYQTHMQSAKADEVRKSSYGRRTTPTLPPPTRLTSQ